MAKVQAARTPRKKVVSLVTPRVERALEEVLAHGLKLSESMRPGETAIAETIRTVREMNRGTPRAGQQFRNAVVELLRAPRRGRGGSVVTARDRREARVVEAAPSQMTAEQHAFLQGKRAPAGASNPYRARDLRDAWTRGREYALLIASGLRPLDTARRL